MVFFWFSDPWQQESLRDFLDHCQHFSIAPTVSKRFNSGENFSERCSRMTFFYWGKSRGNIRYRWYQWRHSRGSGERSFAAMHALVKCFSHFLMQARSNFEKLKNLEIKSNGRDIAKHRWRDKIQLMKRLIALFTTALLSLGHMEVKIVLVTWAVLPLLSWLAQSAGTMSFSIAVLRLFSPALFYFLKDKYRGNTVGLSTAKS